MKLFGRRAPRPEPERRTLIFDHCYDDLALDAALDGLREGDLRAAQTVLAECRTDAETRNLRLLFLAEKLVGHADEIAGLARRYDEPELWLLAGQAYVDEAGAIRGTGWASSVGDDRFKMVHQVAAKAVGPLQRAAELLPDDSTPWIRLMWPGLLLGVSRDQLDEVWHEAVKRAPDHYSAHMVRLQTLASKWRGSEEEMLTFASETVHGAPPGSPLTALMPAACFEIFLTSTREMDEAEVGEYVIGFFGDQRLQAQLRDASDHWLVHEKPHPRSMQAHHYFAAAFGFAGMREHAFRHLLGTRDRFDRHPWVYLNPADPEGLFHKMVSIYWPADVHPKSPMDLGPAFPG